MKNFSKLLLIYISSLFLFGWIWGWAEYSPPEPQPIDNIEAPAPKFKHINFQEEKILDREEEKGNIDDELQIITNISQLITQDYSTYYLGCSYSSSKYVIFRLSMDLDFFYNNYQLIEQEFNKITKYGHLHLSSEKTCIILIENGEKCVFLSENGRGTRY